MAVARIRNPKAVNIKAFEELFLKTVGPKWPDATWADLAPQVEQIILDENKGIFAADRDGKLVGLSVVVLPTTRWDPVPQVVEFYNEGTHSDKAALIQATVAYIKDNGHLKFWAINNTGRADKVWLRALTPPDWDSHHKGSIFQFEVKNG